MDGGDLILVQNSCEYANAVDSAPFCPYGERPSRGVPFRHRSQSNPAAQEPNSKRVVNENGLPGARVLRQLGARLWVYHPRYGNFLEKDGRGTSPYGSSLYLTMQPILISHSC